MRKISKKQNDAPAHLFRQTVNEKKKVIGFLCALGIGVFLLQACNKADDPVPGTDSLLLILPCFRKVPLSNAR